MSCFYIIISNYNLLIKVTDQRLHFFVYECLIKQHANKNAVRIVFNTVIHTIQNWKVHLWDSHYNVQISDLM